MKREYQSRLSGFTLIELLIAIVVGLLVVSVASTVLSRTMGGYLKTMDAAMMQESSFFTTHLVAQHLRQAGYKDIDVDLLDGRILPVRSKVDAFTQVNGSWASGQTFKADSTSVSIRFFGSSDSSGNSDGFIIDCDGNAVDTDTLIQLDLKIVNNQLVCTSGGEDHILLGSSETLNVENVVIRLGIDNEDDGSIDAYVDSSSATSADLEATREVVLRLLLVSNSTLDDSENTYWFDNAQHSYTDRRYRREVIIRTHLRNAVDII